MKRNIAIILVAAILCAAIPLAPVQAAHQHNYILIGYTTPYTLYDITGHRTVQDRTYECSLCHQLLFESIPISTSPHTSTSVGVTLIGNLDGVHTHRQTITYTCCGIQSVTNVLHIGSPCQMPFGLQLSE